jgi:hypothetical protein
VKRSPNPITVARSLSLVCALAGVALTLSACNEERRSANGANVSYQGNRMLSVIGSIRPKADPTVVARIKQEEEQARAQAQAAAQQAIANAQAQQNQQSQDMNPANRDLPAVDQNPISGIASVFGLGPDFKPVNNNQNQQPVNTPPPPQQTATYGGYQSASSLIPPPPAVTLSTQAAPAYPPPNDPYAQAYAQGAYGNPYPNPYANPYAQQPPPPSGHLPGSMFSNTNQAPTISGNDEEPKRKQIVVITPTGMEARSNYKQRDDLRLLLKAAFASTNNRELHDPKIAKALATTDVKLPSSGTRGNISVSQREIDSLFINQPVDNKIAPTVKKLETDLAQAYYRYVYSFNKYTLTQQQVAARKQELEVADSNAEKQRAAADLSAAQQDADGAKDDLHSAQNDLASVAGVQAARTVIQKVSGIAPSIDSLASDVPSEQPSKKQKDDGLLGSVGNAFSSIPFFGHGSGKGNETVAAAPQPKDKKEKPGKRADNKGQKGNPGQTAEPVQTASAPDPEPAQAQESKPSAANAAVSFELKNIQTTPRKSVLRVAIRNNGADSLNIDTDNIAVAEGDKRLAEAVVRSEFDTTLVAPNQEVIGTITIFGRPWNDRLSVSFSDGGKTFKLHR